MAAYITVGATTTHGSKVISGSPHTTHNGIPISRKGDKVICKKCKKVTTILTGDASFIVDGAPIARAGDVTKGSLKDSHEKFTPNAEGVLSKDCVKTRYTSDSHTIIKDNENNYFRIYDNTRKQYVSPNGKPPPTGGLKGKEAKDHMQKQTHLRNTD